MTSIYTMFIHFISSSAHLSFFFFNDTATTEIYPLSLHDALPISSRRRPPKGLVRSAHFLRKRSSRTTSPPPPDFSVGLDRKSTRLNSSHQIISYAVFCLKKKKQKIRRPVSTLYCSSWGGSALCCR